MRYGIGLRDTGHLGTDGYGHGGGGTQLVVNPHTLTVFAMMRNDRGPDCSRHLADVMTLLRTATPR